MRPFIALLTAVLIIGGVQAFIVSNAGETVDPAQLVQTEAAGNDVPPESLFDALNAIGAIGCFEGPSDLSTNPKHMEGFGVNASRRRETGG